MDQNRESLNNQNQGQQSFFEVARAEIERAPRLDSPFTRFYSLGDFITPEHTPILIEEGRNADKCASMVVKYMEMEYGREFLETFLTQSRLSAWQIRHTGLQSKQIEVAASITNLIRRGYRKNSIPLNHHNRHIPLNNAFYRGVGDVLSQRGPVLLFNPGSGMNRQISQMSRRTNSVNSHIGFIANYKTREIENNNQNSRILRYLKANPQAYRCKVQVNGEWVESDLTNISAGEKIQFQDPMILHYLRPEELLESFFYKIIGRRYVPIERLRPSVRNLISDEQGNPLNTRNPFEDKGVEFNPQNDCEGFTQLVQIDQLSENQVISQDLEYLLNHVVSKLGGSTSASGSASSSRNYREVVRENAQRINEKTYTYMIILEMLGINPRRIRPTTMIPVLKKSFINRVLSAFNGFNGLEEYYFSRKIDAYKEKNPNCLIKIITRSTTPERHFGDFINQIENRTGNLMEVEKELCLQMIDDSIAEIDIASGKFQYGTITAINLETQNFICNQILNLRQKEMPDQTSLECRSMHDLYNKLDFFINKLNRTRNLDIDLDSLTNLDRLKIIKEITEEDFMFKIRRDSDENKSTRIIFSTEVLRETLLEFKSRRDMIFQDLSSSYIYKSDSACFASPLEPDTEVRNSIQNMWAESPLIASMIKNIHLIEIKRSSALSYAHVQEYFGGIIGVTTSRGALEINSTFGRLISTREIYKQHKDNPAYSEVIREIESRPVLLAFCQKSDDEILRIKEINRRPSQSISHLDDLFNSYENYNELAFFTDYLQRFIRVNDNHRISTLFFTIEHYLDRKIEAFNRNPNIQIAPQEFAFIKRFKAGNIMQILNESNLRVNESNYMRIVFDICRIVKHSQTPEDDLRSYLSNRSAQRSIYDQHIQEAQEELLDTYFDSEAVSVAETGRQLQETLNQFTELALINDEVFDPENNWIAHRMILSTHNRGSGKILYSVMQNWIFQFSTLIEGLNGSNYLDQNDIDSLLRSSVQNLQLGYKAQNSFAQTCEALKRRGYLNDEIMQELPLVLRYIHNKDLRSFISNPLVRKLNLIYKTEKGSRMQIVFSESQMRRTYFMYGGKLLRNQDDLMREKVTPEELQVCSQEEL